MKRSQLLAAVSALSLMGAVSAMAESAKSIAVPQAQANSSHRDPRRFELFGGLGMAYSSLDTSELTGSDGGQLNLSLLGSYYYDKFVGDLGLGWSVNKTEGTAPNNTTTKITTQAAFAELSPRMILGQRFQIGPVANLEFGTGLDYSAITANNGFNMLLMGGIKAVYEMPINKLDLRLVAKPMTSIALPNRHLHLIMLGLEIGLPFNKAQGTAAPIVADQIVEPKAAPTRLKFDIPLDSVHFATASSELSNDARDYLKRLGAVLAQNKDGWQAAEITGHTDPRGDKTANQRLSERRVYSVVAALKEGGLEDAKLRGAGLADSRPVDIAQNATAWAKNRRVELMFQGVTDAQGLNEQLKKLK